MFPQETKFLVVDDFPTVRDFVKVYLRKLGFSNIETTDGAETALELLKESSAAGQPFNFIISDWNMSGMTGLEFLKICRQDLDMKDIPFVMLTIEKDLQHVKEALSAGATDYIVKPVDEGTMKTKLLAIYNRLNSKSA